MITYQEQTHKDLYLHVRADAGNIEQFTVIKSTTFTLDGVKIIFGILAESHFYTLCYKDIQFTEICACTKGTFITPSIIDVKVADLDSVIKILESNIFLYEFSHIVHSGTISPFPTTDKHEILQIFPNPNKNNDAFTQVLIHRELDKIICESIHTYPNENVSVSTKSSVKFYAKQ